MPDNTRPFVLGLAVAALLADAAGAQRPSHGLSGPVSTRVLLQQESVQKELKLNAEQIARINEIAQRNRDRLQDEVQQVEKLKLDQQEKFKRLGEITARAVAADEKDFLGVLTPPQEKRVKQIWLQRQGFQAFRRDEIQQALRLTEAQKNRLTLIDQDAGKELDTLIQSGGDREERAQKLEAIHKQALDRARAVLTDAQKKTWQELTGKPFDGAIRPTPGPRNKK